MEEAEYCLNCPYNNALPVIFNNGICEFGEKCHHCEDDLINYGQYKMDTTIDDLCDDLMDMSGN